MIVRDHIRSRGLAVIQVIAAILLLCAPQSAFAQAELLPLEHPATRTLIRIYEYGAIPEFPREHLPISRKLALQLLNQAFRDMSLPAGLRTQAEYYRVELVADGGDIPVSVIIPVTGKEPLLFEDPVASRPIAIIEYRDTANNARVIFEPVLDGDLRLDRDTRPDRDAASPKALIVRGGAQLRGTLLDHLGFSARITNGTVAGDSALAARDPRIVGSGSFSITAYGRDILLADGHLRADFDQVAVEVGHEMVQLGGGLESGLLLGSVLPSNYDYLRLGARVGKFAFTHIHAALLGEAGSIGSGPFSDLEQKYLAAHLITVGPFAGLRLSLGESVIYHGRGLELGYLNPLLFIKSQEQYLRDRDNANMYLALSAAPVDGLFLEGELMLDDLRFSLIGDGFWGNKSAWRVALRTTAFPIDMLDLGLSYVRLEPYTYSHFNPGNAYTHSGVILAGGGLQPNSHIVEGRLSVYPLPNLRIGTIIGIGEHGANIVQRNSSTGTDTLIYNAGGDVFQTRRAVEDAMTVSFLDGTLEKIMRGRVEAEYEPLRNLYLRFIFLRNKITRPEGAEQDTQLQFGIRIGAF